MSGQAVPCLRRVEIRNFQKHKCLDLDFVNGVNVIAGRSDLGKSAVIRAIRWVVENRPLGLDAVRYDPAIAKDGGQKPKSDEPTSAKLIFDDCTVERRRDEDGLNVYILNGNENEPFEALRGQVPDEIKEVLRLDADNLQRQHDPYFLIQESGAEVARRINEVANLTLIDQVTKAMGDRINSVVAEIKQAYKREGWLCKEIEAVTVPERAGGLIAEIEQGVRKLDEWGKQLALYDVIHSQYEQAKKELAKVRSWLSVKRWYGALRAKVDELYDLDFLYKKLKKTVDQLNEAKEELEATEEWLEVKGLHDIIVDLLDNLDRVESKYQGLKRWRDDVKRLQGVVERLDKDIAEMRQEYKDLLMASGVCPVCGADVDPDKVAV